MPIIFVAHCVAIYVAFYVHDDAKKRYFGKFWPIVWALFTYPICIIALWIYLLSRPPVIFDSVEKTSITTKFMVCIFGFPLLMLIFNIIGLLNS